MTGKQELEKKHWHGIVTLGTLSAIDFTKEDRHVPDVDQDLILLSHCTSPIQPTIISQSGLGCFDFHDEASSLTFQVISSQVRHPFHRLHECAKLGLYLEKFALAQSENTESCCAIYVFNIVELNTVIWLQLLLSKCLGNAWVQNTDHIPNWSEGPGKKKWVDSFCEIRWPATHP